MFGTVLVACVALYAQAAVVYAWLFMYGARRDDVSAGLSGTAAGATLFSLGAVFLTADASLWTAELGARLLYAGSFVAVGSFFLVALELSSAPRHALVGRVVLVLMALGFVLSALGVVHVPNTVQPGMGHEPALTRLGGVMLSLAIVALVLAMLALVRAWSRRAGARWILVGSAPGAIATIVEQIARARGYEPVFALTILGTVLILVSSWVQLRRFSAVGDDLRAKKAALEASHAALLRARDDRSRAEHLADVGELSVVLATEISRPMASLRRSVANLDAPTVEAGDARPILDEIDAETRHLNHLIGDLLVFARPSHEERRDVRVSVLVEDALRDVRAQTRTAVPAELDVDASLVVRCESEALRRAVAQVIENAATAASGEPLVIRARPREKKELVLEVIDPGEGMDTAVRKRALEPFFTTRPYGTGLGLAIVARVARAHGGRVDIESAHGRGTTVSLTLPRVTEPVPEARS
ncbi:MAG: ATP-binding protein [Sandaracinus sp.]